MSQLYDLNFHLSYISDDGCYDDDSTSYHRDGANDTYLGCELGIERTVAG